MWVWACLPNMPLHRHLASCHGPKKKGTTSTSVCTVMDYALCAPRKNFTIEKTWLGI